MLTGGARQQALMVHLAHEVLAHSTAAAQRLAAQLSGVSLFVPLAVLHTPEAAATSQHCYSITMP